MSISEMDSLTAFSQVVLIDLGTRCGTSTSLDYKTIKVRSEHEGLSFITITLPNFGKDFEKSLDQGFVAHDQFAGFRRNGGFPQFLGGFLELVFNRVTGTILNNPCPIAIQAIRQITLMFGKIDKPCTPKRVSKAMAQFVQIEKDVRLSDAKIVGTESYRFDDFSRIGVLLWADLFSRVDSRIYQETVIPKHGPGATADNLRGNAKYNQSLWTRRMERVGLNFWEQLVPSDSFLNRTDRVTILEPRDEIPVKVIAVPKTLKTPRIIAKEPTCMQYMQQGVLAVIVEEITRSNHARNFIQFESQEPNQRLAREGSMFGALATLDLSEASDRVSNQHVRLLVKNHRFLREAVDSTRSRKADVLGHGVIRLAKFASMGSALCFPFESLVFMTVIFVGIQRAMGHQLTQKDIASFYGRVRVFGDDIIIPSEYVQSVCEELEAFGFRVNANKSFWTGKFRESCGSEYFDGNDVSIVRVRSTFPTSRQHVPEIESIVSLRNHMFHGGFEEAVVFLDKWIIKLIPFPFVENTSTLLGRHAHCLPSQEYKHDDRLHRPLVKGVVAIHRLPASRLDDYGALLKWFLQAKTCTLIPGPWQVPGEVLNPEKLDKLLGLVFNADKDHLERAGRPVSSRIKNRWASPV